MKGEIIIKLENGSLFYISAFHGDPNLDYMSTQVREEITLF